MKNYFLGISIIICTCLYVYANRYHFEKVSVGGLDNIRAHEAIVRLDRLSGQSCTIHSFTWNGSHASKYGLVPNQC